MKRYAFSRLEHLRSTSQFQEVYSRGKRASNERLVVVALPNDLPYSRLGISVSKRVGMAAIRNRLKRLIREAFRLGKEQLPKGFDIIVIPRRGCERKLEVIRASLQELFLRACQRASG